MDSDKILQCDWHCPLCGKRCGGVLNHKGMHQCVRHYIPESFISIPERNFIRAIMWRVTDDLTEEPDQISNLRLNEIRELYLKLGGEKRW